jgi:plastocyanin
MHFKVANMGKGFTTLAGLVVLVACVHGAQVRAQEPTVTAEVIVARAGTKNLSKTLANKINDASNAAVWLILLDGKEATFPASSKTQNLPQLLQRNKSFEPHVLIVPVGTMVEFPNQDPFFHNIFSLYDGRRFDLGLYEAGTKRAIRFDRAGVSFLFCNIHSEMSAVVLSVDTHYFALSDRSGNVVIRNVPDGRYQMNVWYERSSPEQLKELTRVVTISDSSRNLGAIHLLESPNFTLAHKNKYGLDYVPPPNPNYDRP